MRIDPKGWLIRAYESSIDWKQTLVPVQMAELEGLRTMGKMCGDPDTACTELQRQVHALGLTIEMFLSKSRERRNGS